MTQSMEERVAQARAALEETRAAVARAEDSLRGGSAKVRSRDRSVEVVVGPQGEMTQITFLDNKYRSMGATQLSAAVLEAVQSARGRMAQRVMDAFGPLAESIGDLPGTGGSEFDWADVWGPLAATAKAGGAGSAVPTGANSKLRDEIHEDPDGHPAGGGER
ncbi:YbaB/EbfC family nucleoid-associated protein [Streptomyces sp. NPDC059918]|uniref:YbaB/EbfC family nucleoid-associated protein n=1 Tax=unclassified Streptomyces TaxID=2593676 RepID=UPI00365ADB0B